MWRTTAKWSEHVGAETGLTEEERAHKDQERRDKVSCLPVFKPPDFTW